MSDETDALRAELADLRARLADVEEAQSHPPKRPLVDRLGAWGGFLALLIAITTGAVTFWDDIVLRGEKQYEERVENLRGWMTEIADMNAQIMQAQASMDYNRAGALMASFGPPKERLLNKIRPVYAENPELFNARDRFLLANEFLAFGDKKMASSVVGDLVTFAEEQGNNQILAEAVWLRGRLQGLPGEGHDPAGARADYDKAIELTDRLPPLHGVQLRVQILNERLQFETGPNGDCDLARATVERYRSELRADTVPQIMAEQAHNTLEMTLSQAPPRCGL